MTDFFMDSEGNVVLDVVPSTLQHQREVVLADKGHHRFAPVLGVGIRSLLNDRTQTTALSLSVRTECNRAGLPPVTISVVGDTITLVSR